MKKILSLLLVSLLLVACSSAKEEENRKYILGIVGESRAWKHVAQEAAKEGIDLEIKVFSDYSIPNGVLSDGQIDINAFQHTFYFETETEKLGITNLVSIAQTVYAPMGIYPGTAKTLEELKPGDKILIPNDVTNGSRALGILAEVGLIEVDPTIKLPTVKDIKNPRGFEIIEMTATNIPALLPEAAIGLVNSGVAVNAKLSPTQDTIFLEDIPVDGNNPYINIIVVRKEDENNPDILRIVELYQTDEVKAIIKEETNNGSFPVW